MFKALPQNIRIEVDPARVVSFQRSLNNSPVALNGPMVHARAFIVGVYNDTRGTYSLYVSLKPTTQGSPGVLFSCEPREVQLANYRDAEQAALDLVEGHGFVMEGVDFKRLGASEIHKFMAAASIFPPTIHVSQVEQLQVVPVGDIPSEASGMYGTPQISAQTSWDSSSTFVGMPSAANIPQAKQAGAYRSGVNHQANVSSHRQNLYSAGASRSRPVQSQTAHGAPMPQAPQNLAPSAVESQQAHVSDLGVPPEEAIAMLGRLLAIF